MKKQIKAGIYLVLDPMMDKPQLLEKTRQALEGGVSILQIWNHWPTGYSLKEKQAWITSVAQLAQEFMVPLLINEEWKLLQHSSLDGVHFDSIPAEFETIVDTIGRETLFGITSSNDLKVVQWAEDHQLDYVSFCSMFPSPSVSSCDIVSTETVQKARAITSLPLFLSGGITLENLNTFKKLDFQGVALISGILQATSPKKTTLDFLQKLEITNQQKI